MANTRKPKLPDACIVARVMGLDQKEHFAVVAKKQPGWPLALCGPTSGSMAKDSEAEAHLFADAPAMLSVLQRLTKELGNVNPEFPLSAGKVAELQLIVQDAQHLVTNHQ